MKSFQAFELRLLNLNRELSSDEIDKLQVSIDWLSVKFLEFKKFNNSIGIEDPFTTLKENQTSIRKVLNIDFDEEEELSQFYGEESFGSVREKSITLGFKSLVEDQLRDNPFPFFHELGHGVFMYNNIDEYFSEPLADLYALAIINPKSKPKFLRYEGEYADPESNDICANENSHRDFSKLYTFNSFFNLGKNDPYGRLGAYDYSCFFNSQIFSILNDEKYDENYKKLIDYLYKKMSSGSLKALGLNFLFESVSDVFSAEKKVEKISIDKNLVIKMSLEVLNEKGLLIANFDKSIEGLDNAIIEVKIEGQDRVLRFEPRKMDDQTFGYKMYIENYFDRPDRKPPLITLCKSNPLEARVYFILNGKPVMSDWKPISLRNINESKGCLEIGEEE